MSLQFIFPKPRDWNSLEDVVSDLFARAYRSYTLQRYGRGGQTQDGVDIIGPIADGLLGIQCKHHPIGNISTSEIDDEIFRADRFRPKLDQFIIATSADRDTTAHAHVLKITQQREQEGKFAVAIKFWDDIDNWLSEYPDLVYKHFTRYFPISTLEHIRLPGIMDSRRETVRWPVSVSEFKEAVEQTLAGVNQVAHYPASLGITTFPDISFTGIVDLEIRLSQLITQQQEPERIFQGAARELIGVRGLLADAKCSKQLIIHTQVRLSFAFLIGWLFRSVTQHRLTLVNQDQVWATEGLPLVPSRLMDAPPLTLDPDSDELAVIFNISRDITASTRQEVEGWNRRPRAIMGYSLEGYKVASAAHARSIALDLSRKLKNLIDVWQVRHIHLFASLPATLAVLIAYNLNAICPISIYYLDESRTRYRLGGQLTNDL